MRFACWLLGCGVMLWTLGVLSLEASWGINCKVGSVGSTAIRWFMHPIYSNYIYHKLSGYASHKPTTICFRVPHLVWSTLVAGEPTGHGWPRAPCGPHGQSSGRLSKDAQWRSGDICLVQGEAAKGKMRRKGSSVKLRDMDMEGQGGLPAQVSINI